MNSGQLGSKPTEELLNVLKPEYWFSAHLHCKFAALIPHSCGKVTKFLALDKCLPKRRFLQIVDIPHNSNLKTEINYDLEWLTILRITNHLLSVKNINNYMPGPNGNERWCFTPTEEEKSCTLLSFGDNLQVLNNFEKTAEGYSGQKNFNRKINQPKAVSNPQTVLFCNRLLIDDPLNTILKLDLSASKVFEGATDVSVGDETFIDETDISLNSPLQKKIILNLPQPVSETVVFEDSSQQEREQNENEDSSKVTQDAINEGNEDTGVETRDDSETSLSKKFKRRNASIYQSDDGIR
jgi:lariat debranching enzyme